jgi:uroporphyrinogen III methyltransferase/synthase
MKYPKAVGRRLKAKEPTRDRWEGRRILPAMNPATVYLVGAGPGDPSLITARGLRLLSAAEVVVYDHLVHPRLLRRARPEAERIDVGAAAPQPLEQDAISLLLAEKAREGKVVVRLKWGDPFVFDSGGKEALFLHEQGIPFEVVPGVTAPVAAPCYAGVPVTYPGAGDTLTFVRGHEDGTSRAPKVDWNTIARLDGTIVCYAGPRQLAGIVDALVAAGRSSKDWTAVISRGTLPRQDTVQSRLGELQQRLKETGTQKEPAVLVVGAVAGLRDHLRWFDARPLFGKRVLVTRSLEQAGELVERLEDLGAEAIEAPTVRIAPPADFGPLDHACANASQYDWIVFTSANGAEAFMRHLLAGDGDVRSLQGPRLCAVGPGAAERLARWGLKVDFVPAEFRPDAIRDGLRARGSLDHARILIPRADMSRDVLADELRKSGAEVTEVAAYRTAQEPVLRDLSGRDIYRMLLEHKIDVVVFTSASTVHNFARAIGEDQAADLLQQTVVACIGPVTAAAAQQLQIKVTVTARDYTIGGLVDAVVAHYAG